MAKNSKQQAKDRRAKIEAMRQEERSKERRKSLLFIVLAGTIGLLLVGIAVFFGAQGKDDDEVPEAKKLASVGVSSSAADCDDVASTPAEGVNDHQPDGTKVDYETVPPSFGAHWAAPAFPARPFYTQRDRPEMEQLVHNLEHGYTILWYDDTVKGKKLDELRSIAASARENEAVGPTDKFVVSAWDDSYGDLPAGKSFALSHWGAETGYRQLCGKLSGEVVKDFIEAHPATDAPEPNAA